MARTYNKNKTAGTKTAPEKNVQPAPAVPASAEKAEDRASAVVKKTAAPEKKTAPVKSIIAAPDKEVMKQIVYQPSAQILTREVDASETFAIGDDMPIYYL